MADRESVCSKFDRMIADWTEKIDSFRKEGGEKVKDTVETLNKKKQDIGGKVQTLRKASDASWKELRKGIKRSFKELDSSFNTAVNRFKETSKAS